jgi:hypothetical protein
VPAIPFEVVTTGSKKKLPPAPPSSKVTEMLGTGLPNWSVTMTCNCAGDGGTVVAGGDELFEAKRVELGGEVFKEAALERIVAIAVHDLAPEGVGVELEVCLHLFLDVDVLGVELVLLGRLGGGQASVQRRAFRHLASVCCHVALT